MKNAIIVHGSTTKEEYHSLKHPSMSNSHWLPWLQKQLLVQGVHAVTPEVPLCYILDYDTWRREFERFDVREGTTLVGHSCGGGFLVRWLSEHTEVRVGKVILVAPWLDPENKKGGRESFFNFEIDADLVSRTKGVTIFNSDNDMESVQMSVHTIREKVHGIEYREFSQCGHFCIKDLGGEAFPELLEHILT